MLHNAELGKTYKPKPESKNFLLLLFGKNYGIYLKTGHLLNNWVFTWWYLPGIYLGKYLTSGFLRFP